MALLRHFHWGLACLLAAASIVPPVAAAGPASVPSDVKGTEDQRAANPLPPPYFVILDSPSDFNALLQKLRRPDLEVHAVDGAKPAGDGPGPTAANVPATPWVVESVRIRGRVRGDSAALGVELAIVTAGEGPTWVPIRLDGQRLIDAREGPRILDLRMMDANRWQVELIGRGRHRVAVEFRCPLTINPARASLSLSIPEAPSTSLELDFDRREPDLIVGTNEVYGQTDLLEGKGSRLSARLWPRSRVDVSWAVDSESSRRNPPLLTAQGDIAIDIDSEQMRTRSSWVIRCVRGMTRTLEVQVHDRDEVTELRLDDQQVGAGIEGGPGASRLTIPLPEPLRPGAERRLAMNTRRSHARGAGSRINFSGFPIIHAREQSGAIGITQSPDLWVAPTASQGLRRIIPTFLPKDLAERPGTSLAFEFLDQPFSLSLDIEASPPLVRSRSRTAFRLDADRAHSETTIDLQWVRGRPFEVELALGSGLEIASVGPSSVVEAWNLTGPAPARGNSGGPPRPRGLTIRLAPPVRDQGKVSLQIEGFQRLPREGPVKLGLCAPEAATAVAASFSISADRGLSVDLDEEAMRFDPGDRPAFRVTDVPSARSNAPEGGEPVGRTLGLEASGSPGVLPLRITRHALSLRQETTALARVSRQAIDLVQKTTLTVRHGTLSTPLIRVPAGIGRWEVRSPEIVHREEMGRDPDGSRVYRLHLERPVLNRATLEFHWLSPIDPPLDASAERELAVPWITIPGAEDGPTRIELTPKAGILFRQGDPAWTRPADANLAGSVGEAAEQAYVEGPNGQGRPFRFKAIALDSVPMPALLVPRQLIRSTVGLDDTVQFRAWCWVEAHGPVFPFELPEGARIVAARVNGRAADRVDLEGDRDGYRRYRLPLPEESASRPVLIELEYQVQDASSGTTWQAPRLPDDGLVLQTLWEVRLPWDRALLGVPPGWSDENEWYWDGNLWIRRPARDGSALGAWLLGEGAPPASAEDLRESPLDESQHLLFGRTAGPAPGRTPEPTEMTVQIVSRAWLVALCSGGTLLIGFLAIFSRIRFRTVWAIAAGVGLLAAAMIQPSVAAQLVQSSLMGAALTFLGVLIQHLIDRRQSRSHPVREPASNLGLPRTDSSMNRVPVVGSDDPTAVRVRTPSTLDFVPSPLAGSSGPEEVRSSTLGRT